MMGCPMILLVVAAALPAASSDTLRQWQRAEAVDGGALLTLPPELVAAWVVDANVRALCVSAVGAGRHRSSALGGIRKRVAAFLTRDSVAAYQLLEEGYHTPRRGSQATLTGYYTWVRSGLNPKRQPPDRALREGRHRHG